MGSNNQKILRISYVGIYLEDFTNTFLYKSLDADSIFSGRFHLTFIIFFYEEFKFDSSVIE